MVYNVTEDIGYNVIEFKDKVFSYIIHMFKMRYKTWNMIRTPLYPLQGSIHLYQRGEKIQVKV